MFHLKLASTLISVLDPVDDDDNGDDSNKGGNNDDTPGTGGGGSKGGDANKDGADKDKSGDGVKVTVKDGKMIALTVMVQLRQLIKKMELDCHYRKPQQICIRFF